MNVKMLYDRCYDLLSEKNIPTPDIDAKAIISHRLGIERNELFLHKERKIKLSQWYHIERDIGRRRRLEPVAYILGYKYFFHDKFLVSRGTLIPRADTEHLLYAVQNDGRTFRNIIDIGTGSGALAVSLSRIFPQSSVTAVDIRIRHARRNIRKLGCANIRLVKADLFRPVGLFWNEKFDLIVSNPPYLSDEDMDLRGEDAKRYEPRRAFYGGKDGMKFYRKIADFCDNHLQKDGLIVLETDHKWKTVREIFWNRGYHHIEMKPDYNGLDRVLVISRSPLPS